MVVKNIIMSSNKIKREQMAEALTPIIEPIEKALAELSHTTNNIEDALDNPFIQLTFDKMKPNLKSLETVALMKGYTHTLALIKHLEDDFLKLCRAYTPDSFIIEAKARNPLFVPGPGRPKLKNTAALNKLYNLLKSSKDKEFNINKSLGQSIDTLLMVAAKNNETDLVKILLKRGATQRTNEKRYNALLSAIDNAGKTGQGNPEIVEILLKAGADPNSCEDYLGYTALMMAAERLNFEIMSLLITYGAKIKTKASSKVKAFDIAMRKLKEQRKNSPKNIKALKEIFNQVRKECEACGTLTSTSCSSCKKAYYCSKECQTKSWKTHKKICRKSQKPAQQTFSAPRVAEPTSEETKTPLSPTTKLLISQYGKDIEHLENQLKKGAPTGQGYNLVLDQFSEWLYRKKDITREIARAKDYKAILTALDYLERNENRLAKGTTVQDKTARACNYCTIVTSTKTCKRCRNAYYCSTDCQRNDWTEHRSVCK